MKKVDQTISSKIISAINRIENCRLFALREKAIESNISLLQAQILVFLNEHPKEICTNKILTQEFEITKATISDAIKVLEKKNLIERSFLEEDNRIHYLSLTQGGKKLSKIFHDEQLKMVKQIDKLSSESNEYGLTYLLTIIERLYYENYISPNRMCFSCIHYKKIENGFHCNLLNKNLTHSDLRLDCPEHSLQ